MASYLPALSFLVCPSPNIPYILHLIYVFCLVLMEKQLSMNTQLAQRIMKQCAVVERGHTLKELELLLILCVILGMPGN